MTETALPFDVICVGAVNVDTIVPVERVPADDERVTSSGFVTAGGGPAATAAVTIARLGGRVAFCGVVGDDAEGRQARAMLDDEGVDTRWLRVDPDATTARAVILIAASTAGRSIVTTVAPAPRPQDVPTGCSTWIHADQIGYAAARASLATGSPAAGATDTTARTRFSVDAGNPIAGLALDGVDLFVPTLGMLLARHADVDVAAALKAAQREGAREVVATAGSSGAYVLSGGSALNVPSLPVRPISTLGAGDVFHGALLARLVAGDPLVRAVTAANTAAALSCRALDGRSGIPTAAELERHLATGLLETPVRSEA